MQIDNATVQEFITMTLQTSASNDAAKRLLPLMDLTSLNKEDTEEAISEICQQAESSLGPLAAVCVYPQFLKVVRTALKKSPLKIATVVNFPAGNEDLSIVTASIERAIHDGANEIDLVMPYQSYLAGDHDSSMEFIKHCKIACGPNVLLKVIIETGALQEPVLIASAAYDAISAGADFIKTSTGKLKIGATLEAAAIILLVIKQAQQELKRTIGLKVSGGIRTVQQAAQYLKLAEIIMGEEWVNKNTLRFGASSLLLDIHRHLKSETC